VRTLSHHDAPAGPLSSDKSPIDVGSAGHHRVESGTDAAIRKKARVEQGQNPTKSISSKNQCQKMGTVRPIESIGWPYCCGSGRGTRGWGYGRGPLSTAGKRHFETTFMPRSTALRALDLARWAILSDLQRFGKMRLRYFLATTVGCIPIFRRGEWPRLVGRRGWGIGAMLLRAGTNRHRRRDVARALENLHVAARS
jgi:hypothetical protein